MPSELKRVRRRRPDGVLGPLEAEVMERLWKRGRATVRDVVDDLGRNRLVAYTTIMTIMTRLLTKAVLTRAREGKTFVYRPALTRQELRVRVSRDLVRGLVHEFGDVALAHFAAELETADSGHRASLRRVAGKDRGGAR